MKTLLFLGVVVSAVYADGQESVWNHCSRHVLNRETIRELEVRFDERRQSTLASIDSDGSLQTRFEATEAALNGEIQAAVESELARIYPDSPTPIRLQDLRREERTLRNGDQVVYWYRGNKLLVRRATPPPQVDQVKVGQLLEINLFNDNEWSARPTLGNILVFGPQRRPLSEIQIARHIATERPQAGTTPSRFVEGSVPYVSAIYHFEFTARQEVVLDRPSRQEERARSIARNRERRFREQSRRPEYFRPDVQEGEGEDFMYLSYGGGDDVLMAEPDVRVEYGQSMLSEDRPFEPTRPQPVTLPSQPYVTEKRVFYPPTLFDVENRQPSLNDRVAAHGTYIEGGAVSYVERNPVGALHVQVECNAANYCVETRYESGRIIRTVNGRGNRLIPQGHVNRQRFETRPNEDFPWNPYRIPGMSLHLVPRLTPVNPGSEIMIDPIPFFSQQSIVAYGFSATATVVTR